MLLLNRRMLAAGDILLFNTDNFLCKIQRAVTFSSFDHVAVIGTAQLGDTPWDIFRVIIYI